MRDKQSRDMVLNLLHHFHKCAGLKLNEEKTEAMLLGNYDSVTKKDNAIKFVKGPVKDIAMWKLDTVMCNMGIAM